MVGTQRERKTDTSRHGGATRAGRHRPATGDETMQATVTKIERGQKVTVYARVRRGYRDKGVSGLPHQLDRCKVGDKIEVKRVPNCPYICFVGDE